jgi:coenzyme F420-0:L-glutamate ligase / coenzyme F420-1:gamma-L-glutamate ligase
MLVFCPRSPPCPCHEADEVNYSMASQEGIGLARALQTRRTARRFVPGPLPAELVRELVELACLAPAPHHTQPWRFALIDAPDRRARLAQAMGEAWAADLRRDGVPEAEIDALRARSARTLARAPSLLLGSLVGHGLRAWPDAVRSTAEWSMAVQSFGAALQNLLLTAHSRGLAGRWLSWPLFCPLAVRVALGLPADWVPQAFIVLGRPAPDVQPPPRPPLPPDVFFDLGL